MAETEEENLMLEGIAALMNDLGIDVEAYRTDEAYALVFWTVSDLSRTYAERYNLTREEAIYIMEETEPFLQMTMMAAGARYIERTLRNHLCRIRRNKCEIDPDFD